MSANIKASTDGTQAIIGVGGVDQMTVSNAGVVTANSFVGNVTGGGTFSGNASSATALATGSTTARTLATRFADVVNVLDFGADPTGATDSTTAFNACPNGMVFIPEGNYKVKGWIPKNDTTYFGTNNTILTLTSHGLPICDIPDGAQNINFSNIKFVGIASSTNVAIQIFDTNLYPFENNINIDFCSFSTFGGHAIIAGGLKKARITNCSFTKTAQVNIPSGTASWPAIWMSGPTAYASQARDIIIDNCNFHDTYWSAMYVPGHSITVSNNHFYKIRESALFINQDARYVSIIGNTIDTVNVQNISASGVELGGQYNSVIGNIIRNTELYGISVQDCFNFTVVGNSIDTTSTGIGIISSLSSNPLGFQTKDGVVTGNSIENAEYGIFGFRMMASDPPIRLCNISGNNITSSVTKDYSQLNTLTTFAFSTRLKDNKFDDNLATDTIDFSSKGTGNMVLFSLPFRPKSLRFDSVLNNTTAGFSNSISIAKFGDDDNGTPYPRCISSTPNGSAVAGGNAINIYNATFTTVKLQMNLVSVTFNTSTDLWDVNVNIVTNTGEAVWAIYTATE
jgi:hypothetical protein